MVKGRKDTGKEGCVKKGCRYKRESGLEGIRKGGIRDWRDEGFRTGGTQEMRDTLEGSGEERSWTGGIQDSWNAGKVG